MTDRINVSAVPHTSREILRDSRILEVKEYCIMDDELISEINGERIGYCYRCFL